MSLVGVAIASFLGAVLTALGTGGGGILLLYLTAFAGFPQQAAQGLNLAFFLPVGAVAIFLHARRGLIRWRLVLPAIAIALPGVYLGARLALGMDEAILGKLFGLFLLVVGVRELCKR